MPRDLLSNAVLHGADRDPLVHAFLHLYASRVWSALDPSHASRLFAQAVSLVEKLRLNPHIEFLVYQETLTVGATADPIVTRDLYRNRPRHPNGLPDSVGVVLLYQLVRCGEIEISLDLLQESPGNIRAAGAIIHSATSIEQKRRALEIALAHWRTLQNSTPSPVSFGARSEIYRLFSQHHSLLQDPAPWLHDLLAAIRSQPEELVNARFGDLEFRSTRDMYLFQILNALRALRPAEEVDAILRSCPAVAAAAAIYPNGTDSLHAAPGPISTGFAAGSGVFMGSGSFPPTGSPPSQSADFLHMLSESHQQFLEDLGAQNRHQTPRVFWPSCSQYRAALYCAGKTLHDRAKSYIDQIPDTDFALLASIELAAGILDLPQHLGIRAGH